MSTDDKNIKNKSYSVEDLLQDDSFITAITKPTKESEEYWNKAVQEGQIDMHEYKLARYYIESVQVQPERISNDEIFNLWEDIEVRNKQNLKRNKKRFYLYISAVAGIIALATILFSLYTITTSVESPDTNELIGKIEDIKAPEAGATDIQLILADNETLSLEGKDAEITYNEDGIAINNHETDIKKEQVSDNRQLIYNQLIVPMGKRSMLTFAEGSKIWVNAGTRVVYPATFEKGKREIYIDGEAFLEISHDKNSPFIVKTKGLDIEVLGTSFNIMAYEKDSLQSIVLVSGSVKINSENKKETILSPNEMFTLARDKQKIEKVNIDDYTSWIYGIYQYKSENLGVIIKRLARYYGQDIECSANASKLKCSGKLDLKDDLSLVLNGIAKTAPIRCNYNNEKYIITNK